MARRKKLPTYPVGSRVHVKWLTRELDCPGVVTEEPHGEAYFWGVQVEGYSEPLMLAAGEIVGTLPTDDSPEAMVAWLHPAR